MCEAIACARARSHGRPPSRPTLRGARASTTQKDGAVIGACRRAVGAQCARRARLAPSDRGRWRRRAHCCASNAAGARRSTRQSWTSAHGESRAPAGTRAARCLGCQRKLGIGCTCGAAPSAVGRKIGSRCKSGGAPGARNKTARRQDRGVAGSAFGHAPLTYAAAALPSWAVRPRRARDGRHGLGACSRRSRPAYRT